MTKKEIYENLHLSEEPVTIGDRHLSGHPDPSIETIYQIREFNRFYTVLLGFLNTNYLSSGYSVTETRILFEIYRQHQLSANALIQLLRLDKSYISRLIRHFEHDGLIRRTASENDGRMKIIELTARGIQETEHLIAITNQNIAELTAPLPEESCIDICNCMKTIIDTFEKYRKD